MKFSHVLAALIIAWSAVLGECFAPTHRCHAAAVGPRGVTKWAAGQLRCRCQCSPVAAETACQNVTVLVFFSLSIIANLISGCELWVEQSRLFEDVALDTFLIFYRPVDVFIEKIITD